MILVRGCDSVCFIVKRDFLVESDYSNAIQMQFLGNSIIVKGSEAVIFFYDSGLQLFLQSVKRWKICWPRQGRIVLCGREWILVFVVFPYC